MTRLRAVLTSLGMVFTLILTVRGLWWLEPIDHVAVQLLAVALYLATTSVCLGWNVSQRRGLPWWVSALVYVCVALLPSATAYAVGPEALTDPWGTWYIGALGALLTIVLVRGRTVTAWVGLGILAAGSIWWLGAGPALALGLVGSVVWVTVAQLLMVLSARAARDTESLADLQFSATAWQAAQGVRQRERRLRVTQALQVAGPVLLRTITTQGELTDEERLQARLAEGALRDEMRAPRLLDGRVRDAIAAARTRGAQVTLLDEEAQALTTLELSSIRSELGTVLAGARSDRLIVRTAAYDNVAVTVVGRSGADAEMRDDDAVDLWHEIRRP